MFRNSFVVEETAQNISKFGKNSLNSVELLERFGDYIPNWRTVCFLKLSGKDTAIYVI